jgi:site-specific recombinase XerD
MQLIEGPKHQDAAPEEMPAQANSDETLIALWLAGKADRTRRAYQDDVTAFLRFADKSLRQITLADLVAWGETLGEMAPASRARKLGAVKSLAAFGHRIGYLAFDIGAPLRLPAVKTTLAERILGEGDVLRLLTLETSEGWKDYSHRISSIYCTCSRAVHWARAFLAAKRRPTTTENANARLRSILDRSGNAQSTVW